MIPMSFSAGRDAPCPGPMYSLKGSCGAHRPRKLCPPSRHSLGQVGLDRRETQGFGAPSSTEQSLDPIRRAGDILSHTRRLCCDA
jgi:hypothetical protein